MPSTTQRRSPRAAPAPSRSRRPLGRAPIAPVPARPLQAPFAAVFGLLTAVVDGYLGWVLLTDPDRGWGWYLLPFAVLALAALAGAVLVALGRAPGAAVLTAAAALTTAGLLALLVLFLAVGAAGAWWVLSLLVAPVGALALARQRPVRDWTRRGRRAAR